MKPVKEKMTQSNYLQMLADETEVPRSTVKMILEAQADLIAAHLIKGAVGNLVIPFVGVKLITVNKPARKAYVGPLPLKGETHHNFPARKASVSVRARALSKLKKLVA